MEITPNESADFSPKAIEYLKEINKLNREEFSSSHKRFDYLLVTVDGAGLYLCLELLKYFVENEIPVGPPLKFAGFFFSVSILLNLVSQFCTFNVYNNILHIERSIAFDETKNLKLYEKRMKLYQLHASATMWTCTALMIAAFITLSYFIYKSF